MKYTMFIDQVHSIEWGLNLQEAAIFNFLYSVPAWAEAKLIDGKLFYHASRNKAIQDYPIVSEKPDTIYRIYRRLQAAGVIEWMKDGLKDMILITEKGKQWNNSEKNPTLMQELGKKSESTRKIFRKDSEKNPIYNNTIDNHTILLDKGNVEKEFSTVLIDEVDETKVEIHHVPEYFADEEKKERKKVAPKKKEKVADPTPITPMWQEYEKRFADLNQGEPPVFHKKYLRSLKTLFAVLRDRSIKKGIVPLNDVQPWCDFLDMAVQHLKNNPKETYLRGRFDPIGIEAEFNKWITTLNNRPKTDAEKWIEWGKRQGIA